jgi:hypothetical protein
VLLLPADIIQPQCTDNTWSYEHNLYIQLAVPLFIALLVAAWTGLTYLMFRSVGIPILHASSGLASHQ